jgi:hypothetical protein
MSRAHGAKGVKGLASSGEAITPRRDGERHIVSHRGEEELNREGEKGSGGEGERGKR